MKKIFVMSLIMFALLSLSACSKKDNIYDSNQDNLPPVTDELEPLNPDDVQTDDEVEPDIDTDSEENPEKPDSSDLAEIITSTGTFVGFADNNTVEISLSETEFLSLTFVEDIRSDLDKINDGTAVEFQYYFDNDLQRNLMISIK